jgi:polyphosphate glucokinase
VIVTSRVAERPADVEHHRRRSGFEAGGELVDTDENVHGSDYLKPVVVRSPVIGGYRRGVTTTEGERPWTLAVDCGGTGIKATVLDAAGRPLCPRVKARTPYPCPPEVLLDAIAELVGTTETPYDRVSVGFPGMVRHGIVHATPHYVTEAGPFTTRDPDLEKKWAGLNVRALIEDRFRAPTRVLNDAEVAGLAVIDNSGFEVVFTLGTGLGCALFDDGRLLPKLEISHAPFRNGQTYDQQLGHHARRRIGARRWTGRVVMALESLRPVLWWDRSYVGGGGARHLTADLGPDVTIVTNQSGLLGGVRLWDLPEP